MKNKFLILTLLSAMLLTGCENSSNNLPSFSGEITKNEEVTKEKDSVETKENDDDSTVQTEEKKEIKGWINGLYENTTAQPLKYNLRSEKNVIVKQGIENLTQEEIDVAKNGDTVLFRGEDYSFGPSTWETYKGKCETGFYEFPTPYNEGMWNALSNIVIETDNWRLAIVTPEVWVFTRKTEEDINVLVEPFVYNNACSSRLHDLLFNSNDGTPFVYYTPLFFNGTLLGCEYNVGEAINHGIDTVTFSVKECGDDTTKLMPTIPICDITASTNDTGPDYTLEDFSKALTKTFTDDGAAFTSNEIHTLVDNEYCSFNIERYSAQYADSDNNFDVDTFLFENKTDRELLIGFALYPEKNGELLTELGDGNNSSSVEFIEFNIKEEECSQLLTLAPNSISFYDIVQQYSYLPIEVMVDLKQLEGIYEDTNSGSADYKKALDKLGAKCPFVIEIYDAETKELLSQERYYNTDTFFKPEMYYYFSIWYLMQA